MKKVLLIAILLTASTFIVNANINDSKNNNVVQLADSNIQETTGYYEDNGAVKPVGIRVTLTESWSGTKLELHSISLTGRWVKQSGTIYSCNNEKGPGGNYYRYKVKIYPNTGAKWVYFNL